MRVTSSVGALTTLLVGAVSVAVLVIGGREVIANRMTIGGLISFTLYLALVVGPVVQIVAIGTQLSEAFAGLERIREILNEMREDADDPTKRPVEKIAGIKPGRGADEVSDGTIAATKAREGAAPELAPAKQEEPINV